MCLQFGFVIFWQKDFGAKAAHKMLVKLTPGLGLYGIPVCMDIGIYAASNKLLGEDGLMSENLKVIRAIMRALNNALWLQRTHCFFTQFKAQRI